MFEICLYIVTAVGAIMSLVRQFQMLQQNSYYPSRYLKWLKEKMAENIIIPFVFSAIAVEGAIIGNELLHRIIIAVSAVYILINGIVSVQQNKKSIKKLVFTAKIKRMFFAATAVVVTIGVLFVILDGKVSVIIGSVFFVLTLFPAVLCLFTRYFTAPLEKTITAYYARDARKKIASIPSLKVIGITGSYGKTSTKYILGRILSEKYNTVITPESYNTPMGVVKTIREKLLPSTEIFVAEMGAKNKGDIKEICSIANPDMGIITSVGQQHLDTFKTIENICETKFELADSVKKNHGTVFLNFDNGYIKDKSTDYKFISYGSDGTDYAAENIRYNRNGIEMTVNCKGNKIALKSKLLGRHNALNITAAVAVACELGVSDKQIEYAVSQLMPTPHRIEMKKYINGCTLIDDAYNSNPEGCLEAVSVLGCFEGMKKIIVTPGLVELGEKEYQCNYELGCKAAENCDIIILVGLKRSKPLSAGVCDKNFPKENLHIVDSFASAVVLLNNMCDSNTVVLLENDLPDNYLK